MDNHDSKNFKLLDSILSENDIVVDVGANKGEYTDFFYTKLKTTGKIYSIELDKTTAIYLENKYINQKNIVVINKAISDINGEIDYYLGREITLNNILGHDTSLRPCTIGGKIESVRLDKMLKEENQIKLIKIDVEGAELKVLDGLDQIIDKVEYLLIECHLQKDWEKITKKLLYDYNMTCFNCSCDVDGYEKINYESKLAYQCFCSKNGKIENILK
jgi:FkbM family methyltransferase